MEAGESYRSNNNTTYDNAQVSDDGEVGGVQHGQQLRDDRRHRIGAGKPLLHCERRVRLHGTGTQVAKGSQASQDAAALPGAQQLVPRDPIQRVVTYRWGVVADT